MHHRTEITHDMREAIENCQECHSICVEITTYSVQTGGGYADPDHIGFLLDCSQLCTTSADFMLRVSRFHGRVCDVCSSVCIRCAESCERVGPTDPKMKACADICRRAAETCRRMADESV